ncbi:hypothetical protein BJX64DRAFT_113560 [Aspergillus heterothallicus]
MGRFHTRCRDRIDDGCTCGWPSGVANLSLRRPGGETGDRMGEKRSLHSAKEGNSDWPSLKEGEEKQQKGLSQFEASKSSASSSVRRDERIESLRRRWMIGQTVSGLGSPPLAEKGKVLRASSAYSSPGLGPKLACRMQLQSQLESLRGSFWLLLKRGALKVPEP